MNELLGQIRSRFNYDLSSLADYDHGFENLQAARAMFGSTDPVQGTYLSRPTLTYPADNARFVLGPASAGRRVSYTATDLTNGLTAEGQYQAFWGIRGEPFSQNGLTRVGVAVVIEGLVSLNGALKYRAIQTMVGDMVKDRTNYNGATFTPSSVAIFGAYRAVNVETLDSADPRVPCLGNSCGLNYTAVWLRQ